MSTYDLHDQGIDATCRFDCRACKIVALREEKAGWLEQERRLGEDVIHMMGERNAALALLRERQYDDGQSICFSCGGVRPSAHAANLELWPNRNPGHCGHTDDCPVGIALAQENPNEATIPPARRQAPKCQGACTREETRGGTEGASDE